MVLCGGFNITADVDFHAAMTVTEIKLVTFQLRPNREKKWSRVTTHVTEPEKFVHHLIHDKKETKQKEINNL